ncbi:CDP-glycerol glycerophosphotransferase family protein [Lactiplantibacillus plantarum]|uniref:CDP-glycerol glycerophosphotransferase family protein n=1 Tax=Lactiplantibacillus plantarum TaxID=1590 RepID=UPI0003489065|nr:CDP-glycerol glycerophosphotransferase family protein [Lactiplantibacillus plantarum]AYG26814.1 CDP-glycerol--glycerophosphate glycerophosphotransferase [Lactiplantibacillus plantarum]MCB7139819.1 CDP-glycerol glycerophosphotransferase family protein [Lactiplantibacillus plantarum]MCB7151422.1 CDP-glycerol glycerophosphotransferase family protein [Lactiplantibacillus plantarum]MCB7157047.1 CDP-glycerol glycerophosphotransferase family protein [Lactiplantibacillus plantarum]MCB7167577.1 CDP-
MKALRTIIKKVLFKTVYPIFRLCPIRRNYVLFNCNNGKVFDGNPKAIFEELRNKQNANQYKFIVTASNGVVIPENVHRVRYMSLAYIFYLAVSKYWVININAFSGVNPRKDQVFLQTWHGTPLKKIGADIQDTSRSTEKEEWRKDALNWTYFLSNGSRSNPFYKSAFGLSDTQILTYGLPRNDRLGDNKQLYDSFRKERGISKNQKVILYAPTFRDDGSQIQFNYEEFSKKLGSKFYLLVNFHRLYVEKGLGNFPNVEFNEHLSITDCMEVSDLLITDYSSVFFDYSILNRPMIFYPYDYNRYMNEERGTYMEYSSTVPGPICYSFDSLVRQLMSEDNSKHDNSQFAREFNANYERRDASEKIVSKVFGL